MLTYREWWNILVWTIYHYSIAAVVTAIQSSIVRNHSYACVRYHSAAITKSRYRQVLRCKR